MWSKVIQNSFLTDGQVAVSVQKVGQGYHKNYEPRYITAKMKEKKMSRWEKLVIRD